MDSKPSKPLSVALFLVALFGVVLASNKLHGQEVATRWNRPTHTPEGYRIVTWHDDLAVELATPKKSSIVPRGLPPIIEAALPRVVYKPYKTAVVRPPAVVPFTLRQPVFQVPAFRFPVCVGNT